MKNNQQGASEEMILYARALERGMYAGLILMFVTFFIYLFGIIDPLIPLDHIDSFWNQPVQDCWSNWEPASAVVASADMESAALAGSLSDHWLRPLSLWGQECSRYFFREDFNDPIQLFQFSFGVAVRAWAFCFRDDRTWKSHWLSQHNPLLGPQSGLCDGRSGDHLFHSFQTDP